MRAVTIVLDGNVLGVETVGAPKGAAQQRLDQIPVDSVFDLRFVNDSAHTAQYDLCPGTVVVEVITKSEARRRGLSEPPPSLCIRSVDSRHAPHAALLVGQTLRVEAGQVDMLGECDRAPPAGVRWTSSDSTVLTIDATGVARGRAPGTADIIVSAGRGVSRVTIIVAPPSSPTR